MSAPLAFKFLARAQTQICAPLTAPRSQLRTPTHVHRVDVLLTHAETVARFVAGGVSGSGVKGLEGPMKTVVGIIVHIKRAQDNTAACKNVVSQIDSLINTLKAAADTVQAQVEADAVPAARVQDKLGSSAEFTKRIKELQQRLDAVNADAAKLQKQSRLKRIALSDRNAAILQGMSESLRVARDDFMLTGQLAIEIIVRDLAAEVDVGKERQKATELASALEKLPFADASYRASVHARHGRLLAGTRVQLLQELGDWATSVSGPHADNDCPFFILSGGAGTGKSTVAYEVAQRAETAGRLGASFFFMRGAALLSSTEVVFPTLARQLVTNIPGLRRTALPRINEHLKHGARQNMDQQAKDLFVSLLSDLPPDHPPVVLVIDAVDECTESAQELVPRMLFLMRDALSAIACPIRVLVTSRPEVHIEDAFRSVKFATHAQKFRLQEIPRHAIDADIRLFFRTALAELPESSQRPLFITYPDAVEDLVDLASGLFIYAATSIELLKQYRRAHIVRGIEKLLATRGTSKVPLQRLDDLYTVVLSTAFPPDVLTEQQGSIRAILGCISVLQDHIAPLALSVLMGMSLDHDVLPILERLKAVISVEPDDPNIPMRPLHASFGEYLADPARCADPEFYVDPASHHAAIAHNSLSLLQRPNTLVRNICRLPDPTALKNEIENLTVLIDKYIPLAVQYACTYWVVHAALSSDVPGFLQVLSRFCDTLLLEWLEAISFLDTVDYAVRWLPLLLKKHASPNYQGLSALLHDAFRIALEFSPAIKACPEQVYLSAPPFTPSTTQLRLLYDHVTSDKRAMRCPAVVLDSWSPWLDIEPNGPAGLDIDTITEVHVAPHGRWIATCGSADGAIHLCSPDTGAVIQSIHLQVDYVEHIDVASNGLRILCLSMENVCIVSTRSGAVLQELSERVDSATPSRAVFVLEDRAVLICFTNTETEEAMLYIWDPDAQRLTKIDCMSGRIVEPYPSIAVSDNGQWVAVSDDVTQRPPTFVTSIVDLPSTTLVRQFQASSAGVCFVPGQDAVLLAQHGSLCKCDISSGAILHDFGIDAVGLEHLAVSRDGGTIVSLILNEPNPSTIHIWSESGINYRLPMGDLNYFSLSPDGRVLAPVVSKAAWRLIDISSTITNAPSAVQVNHYAIGISYKSSLVALASPVELRLYNPTGAFLRSLPLASPSSPVSTPLTELIAKGLVFNHATDLVVVVRGTHLCICDIRSTRAQRHITLPITAVRDNLRRLGVPNPDKETPVFGSATFTPDDSELVVLIDLKTVIMPGVLCLTSWDVATGSLRRLWSVLLTSAGRSSPSVSAPFFGRDTASMDYRQAHRQWYRTAQISDANRALHFSVADERGNVSNYTVPWSVWGSEAAGDSDRNAACAEEEERMPDEDFYVSSDGWIERGTSKRRIGWIPPSRRPMAHAFFRAIASRRHLLAMVVSSGLLTILNMSTYDPSGCFSE